MSGVRSLAGYQVIRKLPDGRWEAKNPRGQIVRVVIYICKSCGKQNVPPSEFHFPTGECVECISPRQRAAERSKLRNHRLERLKSADNGVKRRQRMAALAKPDWRDVVEIRKIYREARAMTKATGIAHHVDHYYPIQGDWCCGLHVHQNLRVLPMTENCSKNNGHPMEDSPALRAALDELGEIGLTQAKFEMLREAGLVQC